MIVADRYELGRRLGSGGMATVMAGHDRVLDRPVAVKLLDQTVDAVARERFLQEARAAARLHHPNVVQVFDTGEHEERPYIVMELVTGRSVADLVRDEGGLEIEEAVGITAGVLEGLAAAHRVGILHRDVKPANVLLPDAGGVKLADFGIAKAVDDATSRLTSTGTVVGTATYLAPELIQGSAATPASDLYSTGCMLFELLTGDPPFRGDAAISVAYAHTHTPPPDVTARRPDVPGDVATVLERALEKDPARRYTDADEMLGALLDGPSAAAAPAPTQRLDAEPDEPTVAVPVRPDHDERSRRPRWGPFLVAALVALAVLAAVLLLRGDPAVDLAEDDVEAPTVDDGDAADEADDPADTGADEPPGGDDPENGPPDDAPPGDPPGDGPPDDPPGDGPPDDTPPGHAPPGDAEVEDAFADLLGRLASASENFYGDKQDDLLEDLRDLLREDDPVEQAEDARELRREIATWVAEGELDPDIGDEADALLAAAFG